MSDPDPNRLTFRGFVYCGSDGENTNALYLRDPAMGNREHPLVERVMDATGMGSRPISVFYHITDEPVSGDDLDLMLIAKMCGVSLEGSAYALYNHVYSDLTGYLWTNEDFKVGGHDVPEELRSHVGKWCHLVILLHEPSEGRHA